MSQSIDARVDAIVKFLFGFQPPEKRALPTLDWDLFKIQEGDLANTKWNGLCRGEALAGLHTDSKIFIWPEVAHLDLYLGSSTGPAGYGYAQALATQAYGFNNLMAVVNPNLACKPSTAMITKVQTNSRERANQMFGPAQSAVADAVVDCLEHGFFPDNVVNDLVCVVGVFIDPNAGAVKPGEKTQKDDAGKLIMLTGEDAEDSNHRIYALNYVSMVAALFMAVTGGRTPKSIIEAKKANAHVLRGFKPVTT